MQQLYQRLENYALSFPETGAGQSCKNTAIKARKKSFVFLWADDSRCEVMLKLKDSLGEAQALAQAQPEICSVGKTQWVTLKLTSQDQVAVETLEGWIEESFRTLAPKTLVKLLG